MKSHLCRIPSCFINPLSQVGFRSLTFLQSCETGMASVNSYRNPEKIVRFKTSMGYVQCRMKNHKENGNDGSRTHVQRYWHLYIYECSQQIDFALSVSLLTDVEGASLIILFLHLQTAESGVVHLE